MSKFLLFFAMFFSYVASANTIPVSVYAWSEAQGKEILKYSPQEEGYKQWYLGGYRQYFREYLNPDRAKKGQAPCLDADANLYYFTPCMVAALFNSAERSFAEIGIKVEFDYKVVNYQPVSCGDIHPTVRNHKKSAAKFDVILAPCGNNGYTETKNDGSAVIGVTIGKVWAVGSTHVFRHEMSHALGVNGHLDLQSFTFKSKVCPDLVVPAYPQSGLQRDCRNNTFVGHYTPGGCGQNHGMNKQHFWQASYKVPFYEEKFKTIFGCWLKEFGSVPVPVPVPEKKDDPYCKHWLKYVTCEHRTLVEKCPIICKK